MNTRLHRPAHRALALSAILLLGGCSMLTPPTPQKTGAELRQQLLDFTADALTATALPDGWKYSKGPDGTPWDPDTSEFGGQPCSTKDNNDTRQQLRVILYHDPVGDLSMMVST